MVDSTLGIYTGTLGSLTDEGSNDDTYGFGSQVDLAATISTTYMIRVAAYSTGDDGTFALEWGGGCTPPANDDFANATTATGTSGSLTSQTNEAATLQSGELDTHGLCTDNGPCAATSDLGGASVWYAWTAPSNQTNFEVCVDLTSGGANLWPVLGVYTGSLGSLTEVAYGDFATSGGCDTKVSFNAASGTTYMFGVGGEFGSTGGFDLSWTTDSTPPDTDIAGQTNLTNQSPVTFDVTFSEPVSGFDNNDVDLSSSSASTGTVTVTDTGDHAHYTVDVVVTSQGAVTASIPAASAVDGANNSSNASGSAMIVYDSTDPSLSVTTIKVQGAKVTVTFAASDSNGIDDTLCKLDSGSYASCGSPYVRELPKGSHTFYVRALDAAGNQADTSTAFTIRSGKIKI
jgi:hypothetical protein